MSAAALSALLLFPAAPPRALDLSGLVSNASQFPPYASLLAALRAAHARAVLSAGEDRDDAPPLPVVTALTLWQQEGGSDAAAAAAATTARAPPHLIIFPVSATDLLSTACGQVRLDPPGGLRMCCSVLAGQSWSQPVVLRCLAAMRNGAESLHDVRDDDGSALPEAPQLCGAVVRTVTDVLRQHAGSADVVGAAACVLYELAWPSRQGWAPARAAARRCGAVPLLCAALREHAGEAATAASAARALAALLFADGRNKQAAADAGALEALPLLLALHPADEHVARHALWAIGNVAFACEARQARAIAAGAAPAAVRVLAAYGDNPEHAYLGTMLLHVLAGAPASRAAVLAAGGVEACVAAVRAHRAKRRVLSGALPCLLNLLSDEACADSARTRARAAGAEAPLAATAEKLARHAVNDNSPATAELADAARRALALLL
jgi:hypothetical protein